MNLTESSLEELRRVWMENSCGDHGCEDLRLRAAIRVISGGKTHGEWAALLNEEVDALERCRANPMPVPPNCDHAERPLGKPLCMACWDEYKPKFDMWSAERAVAVSEEEK